MHAAITNILLVVYVLRFIKMVPHYKCLTGFAFFFYSTCYFEDSSMLLYVAKWIYRYIQHCCTIFHGETLL